jgi:hypothetical protein
MKKLLVLLAAVAFVVAFTVPAMSADWGFYGSARMATFMNSVSEEASATGYDDDDLTWKLQGNSRLGAKVKAGDIGGRVELGLFDGPTGYKVKEQVRTRLIYGTWNFGGGTLLVGQTYTPVNMFYSNQVWGEDTDMLCFGGVFGGRNPAIQLSFGSFKVALVKPVAAGNVIGTTVDTDTTLPKIEAAYNLKAGPVALALQLGYNTYDEVDAADKEESIDSYFFGVGFNVGLGAAYVKGNVYIGQNLAQYGLWQAGNASATYSAGEVIDNDSTGYLLVVGFKASDTIKLELGYGSNQHDRDDFKTEDDTSAYYAQATINLAKGCFIVPEIGMVDYGDSSTGADQGDQSYFGAKWQINF